MFTFIAITYLFRSLVDGKCFYSVVSMRLVGNNSLMYTLRILTSIEMFLNCRFYSRSPVLLDIYKNGKTVLRKKIFS